jgi:hypothetical protein
MEAPGSDMHAVITKMIRDMKIVGWYYVVAGALYCLTIFGAIFGVPYIIAGLRLKDSAADFKGWLSQEPGALFRALQRQQQHFFIMMVLLMVSVALMVIFMIIFIALMASGVTDFMDVAV